MKRIVTLSLVVGAALAGMLVFTENSDAQQRRRRNRGRSRPAHKCIYTPVYAKGTLNSTVVVPGMDNPDQFAKYTVWSRDNSPHDHKLSPAEAGINQAAFVKIDTDRSGFLDVDEMVVYFQGLKAERAAGASPAKSSESSEKKEKN